MDSNFDANPSVGALEIGIMISVCLFGAVTIQTYSYFNKFPGDSWQMKCLVGAVWLLELGHTICVSHSLYTVSVLQYGQPETLARVPNSFYVAVIFSGLITPAIQVFFANRLRIISGRKLIPIICWALQFLRCLAIITLGAAGFKGLPVKTYFAQWRWLFIFVLVDSTVVDIVVSWSLCFFLWEKRKATFKTTTWIIDRLIQWTFQTGLITSIASVMMLIFCLTLDNYAWMAMLIIISRVFSNCLMASLNSRTEIRKLNQSSNVNFSSSHPESSMYSPTTMRFNHPPAITIEMSRMTEVMVDSDSKGGTASHEKVDSFEDRGLDDTGIRISEA